MKEFYGFLLDYLRFYWWLNTKYCNWVSYNARTDGDHLFFLLLLPIGVIYFTYWLSPLLNFLVFGLPVFILAVLVVLFGLVWLKNTVMDVL